jgi:hypothetical protein
MTTFQDGPAKGQTLMLHRACKFLRVVSALGKWDALDQQKDTPRANEKIHAYQLVGYPFMVHINLGGGRGGFYASATYREVILQPEDATMRDASLWREWCEQNQHLVGQEDQ